MTVLPTSQVKLKIKPPRNASYDYAKKTDSQPNSGLASTLPKDAAKEAEADF